MLDKLKRKLGLEQEETIETPWEQPEESPKTKKKTRDDGGND